MFVEKRSLLHILLFSLWLCQCSVPIGAATLPEMGSYELHSGLQMSLYAREPDVVDPVALTWDDEGRMYVVEMRDYPYGFGPERKPGGTIRLLEDTDNDGKIDRSTLFAEGLSFPTSIAPWNGGVLVTAPPDILFLKDTDGDGKADVREVVLTGFVLGVTDSNLNGLRWGLDNRVHGVNGGNGGKVVSPRKTKGCERTSRPPRGECKAARHRFIPGRNDSARVQPRAFEWTMAADECSRLRMPRHYRPTALARRGPYESIRCHRYSGSSRQ